MPHANATGVTTFTPINCRCVLECGADVHVDREWAFRIAADMGELETMKVLVEHGADVTSWRDWALRINAEGGSLEVSAGKNVGEAYGKTFSLLLY